MTRHFEEDSAIGERKESEWELVWNIKDFFKMFR